MWSDGPVSATESSRPSSDTQGSDTTSSGTTSSDTTNPPAPNDGVTPPDTGTGLPALRAVAVEVAREAAAHIRRRRPEIFAVSGTRDEAESSVQTKSTRTDPVTVVDREAEQVIRARLELLRPGDAILGEEGGGDHADAAGLRWVVDPIDGTVNFLYGIPAYSVSLAVQRDGVSIAGAVVDVVADVTYSAARGAGASMTDAAGHSTPLRCNPITALAMALVATGFGYGADRRRRQGEFVARLLPRVRDIRRMGSAALDLCMVASGRVDAHYEHGLNPWDWAAGALVAEEAGARVRVPSARSSGAAGDLTVASAPGIADELDATVAELGLDEPIPEGVAAG
ncbi:inositol monophosphatase [Rhodococcus triatomae]|nr:inositol monophosphatase [Rhodococcus triatomae]QNG25904.1 inositol monophosphatase [Rhodococcus triatomae]